MSEIKKEVSALLKNYLSQYNVTQKVLAEEIGVSSNKVSKWVTQTYKPNKNDRILLEQFFEVKLKSEPDFALYKGEELLSMGTLNEISQATGKKVKHLKWRWAMRDHPKMLNRERPNLLHLIKIEGDEEN